MSSSVSAQFENKLKYHFDFCRYSVSNYNNGIIDSYYKLLAK